MQSQQMLGPVAEAAMRNVGLFIRSVYDVPPKYLEGGKPKSDKKQPQSRFMTNHEDLHIYAMMHRGSAPSPAYPACMPTALGASRRSSVRLKVRC